MLGLSEPDGLSEPQRTEAGYLHHRVVHPAVAGELRRLDRSPAAIVQPLAHGADGLQGVHATSLTDASIASMLMPRGRPFEAAHLSDGPRDLVLDRCRLG